MKKIILATNNPGKKRELLNVLGDNFDVKTLSEVGIDHDTVEDRDTLEGNSEKKAQEIRDILIDKGVTDTVVIADDSGLFIRALDWKPGVLSARYAGDHDDEANIKKVLTNMKDSDDRYAKYITVLCIINEEGNKYFTEGVTEVAIEYKADGLGGFGYDPITSYKGKTLANMTIEEKGMISHRGMAIKSAVDILTK